VKIGLATDEITLDEYAIWKELEKSNIEYELINLNNLTFKSPRDMFFSTDLDVVINRATSLGIREISSRFFEENGIKVLNAFIFEAISNSKLFTKFAFAKSDIETINYILVDRMPIIKPNPNSKYKLDRNTAKEIEEIIIKELGEAIVKPTKGSRGKNVILISKKGDFVGECKRSFSKYTETAILDNFCLYQNVNNDSGVYAEQFIPHALDLRVPALLTGGKIEVTSPLLRTVRDDYSIAKNTALGAFSAGIELSKECRKLTENSIYSILKYIGRITELNGFICGMDIIPMCEDFQKRQKVYDSVAEISPLWEKYIFPSKRPVMKIIHKYSRHMRVWKSNYSMINIFEGLDKELSEPLEKMDKAYQKVSNSEKNKTLQNVAMEHLENCILFPNEINLRPDFRYNTHNLATKSIPSSYIEVAHKMK
jgi:glutathione synthase/RimK-type ligase-like ATP-grasp enzyme